MSANDIQVGGEHYRAEIQHWDMIEENGIGYLEAASTKYVTRWRNKNGLQDLTKSSHYLVKLIEMSELGKREARGGASCADITRFCEANKLTGHEARFCRLLMSQWTLEDLKEAQWIVDGMIAGCEWGQQHSAF